MAIHSDWDKDSLFSGHSLSESTNFVSGARKENKHKTEIRLRQTNVVLLKRFLKNMICKISGGFHSSLKSLSLNSMEI